MCIRDRDYLELNVALKDVIYKQKEDFSDDEVKKAQEKLNEIYDSFSKKHGYVNNPVSYTHLDVYKRQILF